MEKAFALEIYKLYRSEMMDGFKMQQQSFRQYITFATAILGATIAGMLQIKNIGWIGTVILTGPILNICICILAIKTCSRYYLGALERISIVAKLENILQIRNYSYLTGKDKYPSGVFSKDKYLLPERWLQSHQFNTTEDFINKNLDSGINRLMKKSFQLLITINFIWRHYYHTVNLNIQN